MSEVDNFVSAVKEKREEAAKVLDAEWAKALEVEDEPDLRGIALKAIDSAIGGVLDVVEERYTDLVTGTATDSEGEEVSVELSIVTDLSTLYFEEVSS